MVRDTATIKTLLVTNATVSKHLLASAGTAPTVSTNSISATVSFLAGVPATDVAGVISITNAAGMISNENITLTFGSAYTNPPVVVLSMSGAALYSVAKTVVASTTNFVITLLAPAVAGEAQISYHVIGTA